MTNTNCLANIKCPDCGNEESFRIAATTIVTVTDDGTDDPGNMEWDDDSYAECSGCHQHGTLKDFSVTTGVSPTDAPPVETAPDVLQALESLADQADEDCPAEYRSRHFIEALADARDIIAKVNAA